MGCCSVIGANALGLEESETSMRDLRGVFSMGASAWAPQEHKLSI